MALTIRQWLREVSGDDWLWYAKRLSDNDTGGTEGHQNGPYIPKDCMFSAFPSLNKPSENNPDIKDLSARIDSPADRKRKVRGVWYNKAKDECRITQWGGRDSPLLRPESSGSLCVFAFRRADGGDTEEIRVWICQRVEEEDQLLEILGGSVEEGSGLFLEDPPQVETGEIEEEQQAALEAAEIVTARSRGQGLAATSAGQKALEDHSMKIAAEQYRGAGYEVENVSGSRSYDLHCTRDGEELLVEVKGTVTEGESIRLTWNEVELAKSNPSRMALIVVHSIELSGDPDHPEASNGTMVVYQPWEIQDEAVTPITVLYDLREQRHRTPLAEEESTDA